MSQVSFELRIKIDHRTYTKPENAIKEITNNIVYNLVHKYDEAKFDKAFPVKKRQILTKEARKKMKEQRKELFVEFHQNYYNELEKRVKPKVAKIINTKFNNAKQAIIDSLA